MGSGVESLWYDAFLHGDDIRTALDLGSVTSDALRASVSHIAQILTTQGWGSATVALDGIESFDIAGGGDRRITGDPLAFVLATTGRADPASIGLDATANIYR